MSDWNWNRKPGIEHPRWIAEVVSALKENGIQFTILDPILGIFNCQNKKSGRWYRYYASGGVIIGSNYKGLVNLIKILSVPEYEPRETYNRPFVEQRPRQNVLPFFKEIRNGRPVDNYYPQRTIAYAAG